MRLWHLLDDFKDCHSTDLWFVIGQFLDHEFKEDISETLKGVLLFVEVLVLVCVHKAAMEHTVIAPIFVVVGSLGLDFYFYSFYIVYTMCSGIHTCHQAIQNQVTGFLKST